MNVVAQIEIVKERFKDRVRELASLQVIGIYLFALFILLVVLFASKSFEIPMPNFTGDMPRLGKLKFYSGIMTNLGVFLWSLSGTVCIFALWVLRRYLTTQKVNYLLFSGIISYFFAIDDFFMFHETLELYSGISEKFIFLAYMIVILYYLINYREIILNNNFIFLGLGLGLFGFSMMVDFSWLNFEDRDIYYWIEEGTKFLGILNWAIYHAQTAKEIFPKWQQ